MASDLANSLSLIHTIAYIKYLSILYSKVLESMSILLKNIVLDNKYTKFKQ